MGGREGEGDGGRSGVGREVRQVGRFGGSQADGGGWGSYLPLQVSNPCGFSVQQHYQQLEGIQRHGVLFFQHSRNQRQDCI